MYKCDVCLKNTEKHVALNKKLVSKRDRFYNYVVVQESNKKTSYLEYNNEKDLEDIKKKGNKIIRTFSTKGWEIDREINICNTCKESK